MEEGGRGRHGVLLKLDLLSLLSWRGRGGGGGGEEYRHVNCKTCTTLIVSLFIRCTMRCEIWAQPAELPW